MATGSPAEGLSIGIIMDGNGRWAKKRGLPRTAGHKKGADVFDDIANYASECGVKAITFYAFSTENWSRPEDEVKMIMDLLGTSLKKMYRHKDKNNPVVFLGDRSRLYPEHQRMMNEIEQETAGRNGMILNVAINYGGRQEILRASRQLAELAAKGEIQPEEITEEAFSRQLYTSGQPSPDFILRTSGEMRLSNFLLWQSAYAEMIVTDTYWPDFTRRDFDAAVEAFCRRDRRYGGV